MSARIVLFGATGYTGRLTADAMVEAGARPVLAGRGADRLKLLAEELGGLDTQVADVDDPGTVHALVERGDVLVSTVGPFARWGDPAARAAISVGASYLDSTGEPPFIRKIFERFGPEAEAAGVGLVPACGYDWVPGNFAGALALERAGHGATRIDIGYFATGSARPSGGTMATMAGSLLEPGFAFRDGRIRTERNAARVRAFSVKGKRRQGVSVGASEHYSLPRLYPSLRTVDVYLGWMGPASRAAQAFSLAGSAVARIPGARDAAQRMAGRFAKGSTGGPDAEARSKSGSHIVAVASGDGGDVLAEVHLEGGDGYEFTAGILAWGAIRAAEGGLDGTGALGPVEAFGLDALRTGVERSGLHVTS
jgi:short subunit dehydrogenase-like uncharacterized protein